MKTALPQRKSHTTANPDPVGMDVHAIAVAHFRIYLHSKVHVNGCSSSRLQHWHHMITVVTWKRICHLFHVQLKNNLSKIWEKGKMGLICKINKEFVSEMEEHCLMWYQTKSSALFMSPQTKQWSFLRTNLFVAWKIIHFQQRRLVFCLTNSHS